MGVNKLKQTCDILLPNIGIQLQKWRRKIMRKVRGLGLAITMLGCCLSGVGVLVMIL